MSGSRRPGNLSIVGAQLLESLDRSRILQSNSRNNPYLTDWSAAASWARNSPSGNTNRRATGVAGGRECFFNSCQVGRSMGSHLALPALPPAIAEARRDEACARQVNKNRLR